MRRIGLWLLWIGIAVVTGGCSKSPLGTQRSPDAVQITALDPSSGYIIVRWEVSADPEFASYEVHELPDSSAEPSPATQLKVVGDRATNEFRVEPLVPLTPHVYIVRVVSRNGRHADSRARRQSTLSAECPSPTPIRAYPPDNYTRTSAIVKWSPSCDVNFSRYEIFVSQIPGFTPGPENKAREVSYCTDTTVNVSDLQEATTYYFRVQVVNTCSKTSLTQESTFRTREGGDPIPPDPPPIYNFERSDVTGTTVRVRWKPATEPDWESYQLHYANMDGFGPTSANLVFTTHVVTDTSFVVTGLRPATAYYFIVRSTDNAGNFSVIPANAGALTSPPLDPLYRFGGFGTPPGSFNSPQGMNLDGAGRLYVANTGNGRVDVFAAPMAIEPDTTLVMRIPQAGDASFTLRSPIAVALDDSGNVYISEQGRQRIVRTSPSGEFQFAFGGPGVTPETFSSVAGVAVDRNRNVWVADNGRSRIVKFSATGQFLGEYSQAFSGFLNHPSGVCYDPTTDRLLVVDSGNQRVAHFSLEGVGLQGDLGIFGVAGADSGVFNQPSAVAVDAEGTVYVTDSGNERVQVYVGGAVRPQGIFRTTISPAQFEDFAFNMVRLSRPKACVAIPGRMLVLDTGVSRCVVASVTLSSFRSGQSPGGKRLLPGPRTASRTVRR